MVGLRYPGAILVGGPPTSWRVTKASSITGGDRVIATSGDDLLIGLAVERLDIGEGVGGHDCTLGEGDIDRLGQISTGARRVFGVVTGTGALAIGAAEQQGVTGQVHFSQRCIGTQCN